MKKHGRTFLAILESIKLTLREISVEYIKAEKQGK